MYMNPFIFLMLREWSNVESMLYIRTYQSQNVVICLTAYYLTPYF